VRREKLTEEGIETDRVRRETIPRPGRIDMTENKKTPLYIRIGPGLQRPGREKGAHRRGNERKRAEMAGKLETTVKSNIR